FHIFYWITVWPFPVFPPCLCTAVFPTTGTISGVFVVSRTAPNSKQQVYSFNASAARDVCQDLGASIATKAQVAQALTQGLETCRQVQTSSSSE
uniref:Link domain-containing protein n=1 Tax=Denticeps clupeoides TaxID=299321 RepID=A0AAY4C5R6_9TELE